jgi:hypothetical protein
MNGKFKMVILVAACLASTTGTASAGWPIGLGGAYVRRYVGPQVRFASPWAYSALLAANRSVPPQVKNGLNNSFSPYRGGGAVWNPDLYYARSLPPEVRNRINKENGFGGGYAPPRQPLRQPQPQPPIVIYVLPPASAGAAQPIVPGPPAPAYSAGVSPPGAISAPPVSDLPDILRQ